MYIKDKHRLKYEDLKHRVDFSYPIKKKEQDEYLRKHWEGFNQNIRELEGMVKKDFSEILKCVKLNNAEVLGFKVRYFPSEKPDISGKYEIKITKWKSSEGKVVKDNCNKINNHVPCPHSDLAPILGFMGVPPDPLITEFKNKYKIDIIKDPDNDCHHK